MIITSNMLKSNYPNYLNVNSKISREAKKEKIIKIKNGLYETNKNVNGYLLAGSLYGPSYLSFDFALSFYELIPERVVVYTSATTNKKKKKTYQNHFGTFVYRDVPLSVYPLGVTIESEGEYYFQIATAEKALCDKLYTLSPMKNMLELENMLFNDLRIDKIEFDKLKKEEIEFLAKYYHSTNVTLLAKYMKGKV